MSSSESESVGRAKKSKKWSKFAGLNLDKSNVLGWKRIFDFNHHRNESFQNRLDYRLVLLILSALDSQTSFNLTSLLAFHGPGVIIPFLLITAVFALPFTYTEMYLGSFAGTGSVWSIKNMTPIAGGIGIAMLIHAYVQLVDDMSMGHQFSLWSFRVLYNHKNFATCQNAWNDDYCVRFKNRADYYPENFNSPNHTAITKYLDSRPLLQFIQGNNDKAFDDYSFDWVHMLTALGVVLVLSVLSLIQFRRLASVGKYFIFPAFTSLYIILLVTGIMARVKKKNSRSKESFEYEMTRWDAITSLDAWAKTSALVFRNYAIAHGAYAGMSRRCFQGKSIIKETLINIVPTMFIQMITAAIHMVAAPGIALYHVSTLKGADLKFGDKYLKMPALWLLETFETIWFVSCSPSVIGIVWILQIFRMAGKVLIYIDTVRVGIMELFPSIRWPRYRRFLSAAILTSIFLLGFLQFGLRQGSRIEAIITGNIADIIFQVIIALLLILNIGFIYTAERVKNDMILLCYGSAYVKLASSRVAMWMIKYWWRLAVPIALIGTAALNVASRIENASRQLKEETLFIVTEGISWGLGAAAVAVIFLYAGILFGQLLIDKEPVGVMCKPTKKWGPCELRLWKGEYSALRMRYTLRAPLDEQEAEEMRRRRQAVQRSRESRESFSGVVMPRRRSTADLDRNTSDNESDRKKLVVITSATTSNSDN